MNRGTRWNLFREDLPVAHAPWHRDQLVELRRTDLDWAGSHNLGNFRPRCTRASLDMRSVNDDS